MKKKKTKKQEREEAAEYSCNWLREHIKPGDTVYTSLKHVSRSGMFRVISVLIIVDGEICDVSGFVCQVFGEKYNNNHGGVPASGCGMDMGFDIVYWLGWKLYKDGYQCPGEKCQHNDHHNPPYPPKDGKDFHKSDPGYAFRQRWV